MCKHIYFNFLLIIKFQKPCSRVAGASKKYKHIINMNGPPPWLRVTESSLTFLHNKPSYDLSTAFYHIDLTSKHFVKKVIIYTS